MKKSAGTASVMNTIADDYGPPGITATSSSFSIIINTGIDNRHGQGRGRPSASAFFSKLGALSHFIHEA